MAGLLSRFFEELLAPPVHAVEPEVLPPASSLHVPIGPQNRHTRIMSEVVMIAPRFAESGGVYFDEENGDWLIIPKYPLPARWGERWCQLLVVFPALYPSTPPNGFYLNKRFPLAAGGADPHLTGAAYHGATNLLTQGWHWYCVQVMEAAAGGWSPKPDYREPDNLWTFLALVRDTLTNDQ